MRKILLILCMVIGWQWCIAQQWTHVMNIATQDSTLTLHLEDIKEITFDSIQETMFPDDTTNIPTNISPQKTCMILDFTANNGHDENNGEHSRNVYSAIYMAEIAGIPYSITSNVKEATDTASIILCASPIKNSTLSSTEITRLTNWVKKGGILMAPAIVNANAAIRTLFGINEVSYNKTRASYHWNSTNLSDEELSYFDEPEEQTVFIGKARNPEIESIKSYAYTLTTGKAMAFFETGENAVVRNQLGKGTTYTFGILWRDVIQRSQLGKNTTATRTTSNGFEPSGDIYAFFIRALYAKKHPISVWKFTIPDGYESLLIPTHDCDSRTSYDNMFWMSEYEKSLGLRGHYFLTVHYYRNPGYLSAFYDSISVEQSQELLADGHTVGSHSVCHFPDFSVTERFPIKVVTKEEYAQTAKHDSQTGITTGGSTWAELVLSKQIIEETIGNQVRSFRSGHLCMNKNIPTVQKEAGYHFSSCYASCNVLSLFPFHERMQNDWAGELGVLQMPLHISDVINSHPMSDSAWMHAPDIWLNVMNKLKNNYAPSILLIHPNRDWKMYVQKMLIDRLNTKQTGLYNFEEYGDFWLARENLQFNYGYNSTHQTVIIHTNSSSKENKAHVFAIDVQPNTLIKRIILVYSNGETQNLKFKAIQKNRLLAFP